MHFNRKILHLILAFYKSGTVLCCIFSEFLPTILDIAVYVVGVTQKFGLVLHSELACFVLLLNLNHHSQNQGHVMGLLGKISAQIESLGG